MANPDIHFIITFDVLQIFGLISLSAIFFTTWFSPRIRRSAVWFSYIFSWILSCIGYLLIIGRQTGPAPGHVLCLCQAMLIYALPVLSTLTSVSIMLEIFFSISDRYPIPKTATMCLLFVPYGVFATILVEVLIVGLLHPKSVFREPSGMFFCHTSIRIPSLLTAGIVISALIAFLVLGVCTAIKCRRNWSVCKPLLIRSGTPVALVLRVGLVGACLILSIGLAIIDTFESIASLSLYKNLSLACPRRWE